MKELETMEERLLKFLGSTVSSVTCLAYCRPGPVLQGPGGFGRPFGSLFTVYGVTEHGVPFPYLKAL